MAAEDVDVEQLSDMLSNTHITPNRHLCHAGVVPVVQANSTSLTCLTRDGLELPDNEVLYIIAAHGGWMDGPDAMVTANRNTWDNLQFGIMVPEGKSLYPIQGEPRQDAVIRHIKDILHGKIQVFKRFPWRPNNDNETAVFPNLQFAEGENEDDPFVSTIVRYFRGNITFFELTASCEKNRLTPFDEATGYYSQDGPYIPKGNHRIGSCKLSTLLPIISSDVRDLKQDNIKTTIVFATCLDGLTEEIKSNWTRRGLRGGKRKKKKSKRRKSHKRKTRKRKPHKRKTHKRKTHKRKKIAN